MKSIDTIQDPLGGLGDAMMNEYIVEYYDATGYASFFECVAYSLDSAARVCERDNPGCTVSKVTASRRIAVSGSTVGNGSVPSKQ